MISLGRIIERSPGYLSIIGWSLVFVAGGLVSGQTPTNSRLPQERLRIAVLDFSESDPQHLIEGALRSELERNERVLLLEPALVSAAATAAYSGSLNLSLDEARQLGSALGCDAYLVGRVTGERHVEFQKPAAPADFTLFIALFLVDARSGRMIEFDSISGNGPTLAIAHQKLLEHGKALVGNLVERAIAFREAESRLPSGDVAEDLPAEGTPQAREFAPPQFFRRFTPGYPELAARFEVVATVEASVVFRSDGTIGDILITRWAGFGLDESAIETIRTIKFEPAKRKGKPVSVRAPVRYNFRGANR